jgi:RimJ/RimL family protein N-acetyltransferase
MERRVLIKDGQELSIRQLSKDDFEASLAFFRELPPEDRVQLRADLTKPEVLKRRLRRVDGGKVKRLVALAGDRIVADAELEHSEGPEGRKAGELRVFVARSHQRRGLGHMMARELYTIASGDGLDELYVNVKADEEAALRIFQRLGFRPEDPLEEGKPRSAKAPKTLRMRCGLAELWQELEHYLHDTDWPARGRTGHAG